MPSTSSAVADPVERLREAARNRNQERTAVDSIGEERLRNLREERNELERLVDAHEDRAKGDGDFQAFIEFQEKIATFTERLREDLPERETFEEIDDTLQRRRLRTKEFEKARSLIDSIDGTLEPLDAWEDAREEYREARRSVRSELGGVEEEIADLERLERLGQADLDAPTERLREPIEAYNDAVTKAFADFRDSHPASEVFAFLETTAAYPLVPFDPPPDDLAAYVESAEVGTEPIPQLLSYADYSRSKLDHYVADPARLKRVVGGRRTFLSRLDGDPLTVDWPPPEAAVLRYRCEELLSVVARLPADLVADVRDVRSLAERGNFARLRESAEATAELGADERRRLASGDVSGELADARQRSDQLAEALEEYPEP